MGLPGLLRPDPSHETYYNWLLFWKMPIPATCTDRTCRGLRIAVIMRFEVTGHVAGKVLPSSLYEGRVAGLSLP